MRIPNSRYRIVIVLSGQIQDDEGFRSLIESQQVLVCADGGARHLHRLNRLPDRLVGDLDSIDPIDLAWVEAAHIPIDRFPSIKDETDAELAVSCALEMLSHRVGNDRKIMTGDVEIVFLGALGGRPDHVLANQLMAVQLAEKGYGVMLSDGQSQIYPLVGPGKITINQVPLSQAISAVPISSAITGLTYTGLKYPLENATLPRGSCRGVSNRPLAKTSISVSLETGSLLLIMTPEV